jgi:DNA-binding winged helix-turn-helix (wHTH) protein
MHKYSPRIYSFDDFTLDLNRGCLLRSGQEIRLRPKSFEVFRYLVEHHGRLVSKSDLMHAVWADAFVTDDSLVQCLIEVRRALGDESRRYVRTVPRRGYIFEAQLRETETPIYLPLLPRTEGQRQGSKPGWNLLAIVMIWNRNQATMGRILEPRRNEEDEA